VISSPEAILKLSGAGAWRGLDKSNGVLMIGDHVPRITTSYSRLAITTALAALGLEGVPFGNAVWYDDANIATDTATIYTGAPTTADSGAATPAPRLAGIIKHEQGLQTGFPTDYSGPTYGNLLLPHMKGTLIKRGYVWYKTGLNAALAAPVAFADITRNMVMFVQTTTGLPVFGVPTGYTNGVPTLANCTYIGKIVQLEVENQGWLVEVNF
jgi:hypothetical protein